MEGRFRLFAAAAAFLFLAAAPQLALGEQASAHALPPLLAAPAVPLLGEDLLTREILRSAAQPNGGIDAYVGIKDGSAVKLADPQAPLPEIKPSPELMPKPLPGPKPKRKAKASEQLKDLDQEGPRQDWEGKADSTHGRKHSRAQEVPLL